jgi:hypothetical protein
MLNSQIDDEGKVGYSMIQLDSTISESKGGRKWDLMMEKGNVRVGFNFITF